MQVAEQMKGHKGGEMRLYYGRGRSSALASRSVIAAARSCSPPRPKSNDGHVLYELAGGRHPTVCVRERKGEAALTR